MQQEVYIFYDGCDCENKATSLVSIAANEEESGHDQGINPRVREALKRISYPARRCYKRKRQSRKRILGCNNR